jgi:hypothetical protein
MKVNQSGSGLKETLSLMKKTKSLALVLMLHAHTARLIES